MTRYSWTEEIEPTCDTERPHRVYRLRADGYRNHCVSLWLEATEWHWTIWQRGEVVTRGSVHGRDETPLATAQRLAIEHARDVGVIKGEDEVVA